MIGEDIRDFLSDANRFEAAWAAEDTEQRRLALLMVNVMVIITSSE